MGQNAAEAVENALEALCTADTAAAQKIVQGDDRINNMEREDVYKRQALSAVTDTDTMLGKASGACLLSAIVVLSLSLIHISARSCSGARCPAPCC